jgi:MFS transporter, DHA1 family, inner membrane transport protein
MCLFGAQAAVLVLTPLLPELAEDLDVSVATAGQLRSISGVVAGFVAAIAGVLATRVGLRRLLAAGLAAILAGCAASGLAPSFITLGLAQALVGVGVALAYSAAVAGTAEWSSESTRATALATALLGPPLAWVFALPLAGLLGATDWRLSLTVPIACVSVALGLLTRLPSLDPVGVASGPLRALRIAGARRWAASELLVFGAWSGTLVYSGALLVEAHDLDVGHAGLALGLGALAYVPGSIVFRRLVDRRRRALLVVTPALAAAAVTALYALRTSVWLTIALFAFITFLASGRSLAGSAVGLDLSTDRRVALMGIRTSCMQFGYLIGAATGGIALAAGGYTAMGFVFASLHLLSVGAYVAPRRRLP